MYRLIKLEFYPLYPVCDGELIFFTGASNEEDIKNAIEDIRVIYLAWVQTVDIKVTYLGEFEPLYDNQFENNVISYQNGNY